MQNETQVVRNNKLKCKIEKNNTVAFFSLVDYRNKLFTSDDPDKILEFYNGFEDRDQLIQWMKERPKGVHNIYEVEGSKDIIVVIPTADFNGKYAMECRNNIFKGLHMVFVESGGRDDFYFNYAHNCNAGTKKALEYNPKWIVISGDDMIKIDAADKLKSELSILSNENIDAVFPMPAAKFHSCPINLVKFNKFFQMFIQVISILIWNKEFKIIFSRKYGNSFHFYRRIPLLTEQVCKFLNFTDFSILSEVFVRGVEGKVFDETYVSAFEDIDLSLEIFRKDKYTYCSYRIGEILHGTLGSSKARDISTKAGLIYLTSKLSFLYEKYPSSFSHEIKAGWYGKCLKP